MKKLLLILLCLPMIGFGQSWEENGEYIYSNDEMTLKVSVFDYGEEISIIINNLSKEEFQGNGYWHSINMNGADEEYDGPDGFYEWDAITPLCDGEFDFFNKTSYLLIKCGDVESILYLK